MTFMPGLVCLQVDPHLDRFTADLHQRVSSQTEEQQLKQPAPAATTLSFTAKVSSQEAAMPDATQEESQTAPTSSAKAAGVTVAWCGFSPAFFQQESHLLCHAVHRVISPSAELMPDMFNLVASPDGLHQQERSGKRTAQCYSSVI